MAEELSLNEYGRAANDAIARWKSEMAKSGKKLEGVCQDITKLGKKKALTAEEAKELKECTRLRDGIREYIVAESKKLDSTLQSFKLKKDTDAGAYGKVQGKLGTLIKDGVNPPYVSQKGVPALNTFLVFVPVISVPAGFTADNLPTGITFMGRPYEDGTVIRLAYTYEQGTHHRRPPETTPKLAGEP
jgi:hypothetical protein